MLLVLEGGCAYGATVGGGEGGLHVLVGGAARCGPASGPSMSAASREPLGSPNSIAHRKRPSPSLRASSTGHKARSLPFAGTRQAACSRGRARRIKHRRDGLLTRLLGIEGVFRAHLVRRCSRGGPSLAMGQRVGNVLARRLGFPPARSPPRGSRLPRARLLTVHGSHEQVGAGVAQRAMLAHQAGDAVGVAGHHRIKLGQTGPLPRKGSRR